MITNFFLSIGITITAPLEILIISFLILFQSIFGVGLLLFGTPTLLYYNYSFSEALFILLPISITISIIQFSSSKQTDKKFIKDFNIISLPSLAVALFLVLSFLESINIKVYVALMLIIVSICSIYLEKKFQKFLHKKNKLYFLSLIGITHGFTNLGGGFLVLYSDAITKKKELTRYYISYGYLIMGIVQLTILFTLSSKDFYFVNLVYIFFVFFIYFPGQFLFKYINKERFSLFVKILALIYGCFVLFN